MDEMICFETQKMIGNIFEDYEGVTCRGVVVNFLDLILDEHCLSCKYLAPLRKEVRLKDGRRC